MLQKVQTDVTKSADELGIPVAFALGLVDKESSAASPYVVGSKELPIIRIEGHYFYARLKGTKLQQAINAGLAARKAGAVKNPKTQDGRYAMLKRMAAIDTEAAYQSISIGIGQVMGANCTSLGYVSAVDMFKAAVNGTSIQAWQMLKFVAVHDNLKRAANAYNYAVFARGYNGPNYKKYHYDTELKTYVDRWKRKLSPNQAEDVDVKQAWVDRIVALGYGTVQEFQEANGLTVDGIVGPITRDEVVARESELQAAKQKPTKDAAVGGGACVAVGTAAVGASDGWLDGTMATVQPVIDAVSSLSAYGPQAIAVVAFAVAGYLIYRGIKSWLANRA